MSLSASQLAEPLVGPARIALNHSNASIHDGAEAARLGFRGSAVAGSLHLDLFAPLLVETYGQAWFERGALSVYFLNIVVSGEPVQAVVERPASPLAQTRVHARRADDPAIRVCEGTASLGDHSRSELALRDRRAGAIASTPYIPRGPVYNRVVSAAAAVANTNTASARCAARGGSPALR